jgi:hypothetical protein
MSDFTAEEKRACIEREIKRRKRVFPNRIETGRMSKADARHEIECMEEIYNDMAQLALKERLL